MGHIGHRFHANLHYRPKKPYGKLTNAIRTGIAIAAFPFNPFMWLFAYWVWDDARKKKRKAQKSEAPKAEEQKRRDAFMDEWKRKYCAGRPR